MAVLCARLLVSDQAHVFVTLPISYRSYLFNFLRIENVDWASCLAGLRSCYYVCAIQING